MKPPDDICLRWGLGVLAMIVIGIFAVVDARVAIICIALIIVIYGGARVFTRLFLGR